MLKTLKLNKTIENNENIKTIQCSSVPLDFCNMEIAALTGNLTRDRKNNSKIWPQKTYNTNRRASRQKGKGSKRYTRDFRTRRS